MDTICKRKRQCCIRLAVSISKRQTISVEQRAHYCIVTCSRDCSNIVFQKVQSTKDTELPQHQFTDFSMFTVKTSIEFIIQIKTNTDEKLYLSHRSTNMLTCQKYASWSAITKKSILKCNLTFERMKNLSREYYYCVESTGF